MEVLYAAPQLRHHKPDSADDVDRPPETETLTPLMELVAALEHATAKAKHFSSSSKPDLPTLASLRNAHQMIGSFLSQFESQQAPAADGDELMCDWVAGEEEGVEEEEGDGSRIIDEVEEGMRECALQSKRRKRHVPLSWPSGRPADQEYSSVDPMDRRRSAMDLIFQFHG